MLIRHAERRSTFDDMAISSEYPAQSQTLKHLSHISPRFPHPHLWANLRRHKTCSTRKDQVQVTDQAH
jgi:hypothetical protein